MDPTTSKMLMAAGAAAADPLYVDDVFSTFLWQGTGSSQTINNGIDLAGEGGLVWSKNRGASVSHLLNDSVRGKSGSYYNQLSTDTTGINATSTPWGATLFNNNGFSLGGSNSEFNLSGDSYVSWTFRKAPGFFDVVTYTGNGSGQNISHSLGSVPGMIIIKSTNDTRHWWCYHRGIGNTGAIALSLTGATTTAQAYWNNTSPTSSVFTVGADADVNASGTNYVAYIFAHDDASFGTDSDQSIIKCGSYTGNATADTDEQFIDIGFEPQWVLVKKTSGTADWNLIDINRTNRRILYPSNSNLEDNNTNRLNRFRSTGFDLGASSDWNGNGQSYIYMAIRRPHKPVDVATDLFSSELGRGGVTYAPKFLTDFNPDWVWERQYNIAANWDSASRLIPEEGVVLNFANAANNQSEFSFDYQNGWYDNTYSETTDISYMFRRAPGFFDQVTYVGNSANSRIHTHNLGVAPELMIWKNLTANFEWCVRHSSLGTNTYLRLNRSNVPDTDNGTLFQGVYPSNTTTFTTGGNSNTNRSGHRYLVSMFATLPGISKVGTYTGNGGAGNALVTVECGFTSSSRFILIRRADAVGDWYLFDSTLGINFGNDPYLLTNSSNAAVTNTDYVKPYTQGFRVLPAASTTINISGANYIFLAIA